MTKLLNKGEEPMSQSVHSSDEVRVAENSSAVVSLIFEEGPFEVKGIGIPEEIADAFLVTDIKVGKSSQLVSSPCLPASFFARSRPPLAFDLVPRGGALYLTVTNVWKGDMPFSFSARGKARKDEKLIPGASRRVLLGLGSTLVPAQGRATVRVQTQLPFKPDMLAVPRNLEGFLKVEDLRVVGASVFDDLEPVKEEDGRAVATEWNFPSRRMRAGDWLVVEVKSRSVSDWFFGGTVVGTIVQ